MLNCLISFGYILIIFRVGDFKSVTNRLKVFLFKSITLLSLVINLIFVHLVPALQTVIHRFYSSININLFWAIFSATFF